MKFPEGITGPLTMVALSSKLQAELMWLLKQLRLTFLLNSTAIVNELWWRWRFREEPEWVLLYRSATDSVQLFGNDQMLIFYIAVIQYLNPQITLISNCQYNSDMFTSTDWLFGTMRLEALSHDKSLLPPSAVTKRHLRSLSPLAAFFLTILSMNWVILYALWFCGNSLL